MSVSTADKNTQTNAFLDAMVLLLRELHINDANARTLNHRVIFPCESLNNITKKEQGMMNESSIPLAPRISNHLIGYLWSDDFTLENGECFSYAHDGIT